MLALQALCLYDAMGPSFDEQIDDFLRDTSLQAELGIKKTLPPELVSFARRLATETWQRREQYDAQLTQAVAEWSIRRMAPVDRNILRLGLHELFDTPDTPYPVVINEAIELARRFGDADSPAFVNGVLDGIRRASGIDPEVVLATPPAPDETAPPDAPSQE